MKNFILILAVFLLSGCSTTIRMYVPYAQIDTPDVVGDGLGAAIGGHVMKDLQVVADAQSRPPEFAFADKGTQLDTSAKVHYTFGDRLELGLRTGLESTVTYGTAKLQVIGDSSSKGGTGPLFGIYGKYGQGGDEEDGDQRVTGGPGGYPWNAHSKITVAEGGASLGYRFSEGLTFFLGAAYADYDARAEVNQDRSATGDDAGGQYLEKYFGYSKSAGAGLTAGKDKRFTVYGMGTELTFTNLGTIEDIQGGIEYTIKF